MKRKIYLNKVSLVKAKEEFFSLFSDYLVDKEKIKVTDALGRITAEPVYARRSAPHYHASAMDGIAVRAEDTAGASERNPVKLEKGKEARLIDTGQPLPEGFNAVIKIEEVNSNEQYYQIEKGATPWQHVRSIGESIIKGEMIVSVNHRLTAADIGGILEAGITEITVRKKPRVGIIPTGSELVAPAQEPDAGQLTEFNSAVLSAYLDKWGADSEITEIIPDDYQQINDNFREIHNHNDITVILSGSSAGEEDYTLKILQEAGEVIVHGVNIMPGKPVILARVEGKPVIGLPGYPLAAILNTYLFLRPLLYQITGRSLPEMKKEKAEVRKKIPSEAGTEEFIRVNLREEEETLVAVPRKRGSAAMKSLLRADGVMVIPEDSEGLMPGHKAPIYFLKPRREITGNLLFVGSHDLCLDILQNLLAEKRAGFTLNTQSVGSMGGLMALKRGESDFTGTHLLDKETGEYNKPYVERILPERELVLINFVYRKQGFFVSPGNPLNIECIEDLTGDDILFINRQRGSGTRILLDYWLKKEGILPEDINGYNREEYTHINVAAAVAAGSADTGLGIKAAAGALGLDFIPLLEECYDFILPAEMLNDDRVKRIISLLRSSEFQKRVTLLGGYRTDRSGEITRIEGSKTHG